MMHQQKRVGIWLRVSTDMQVKDESPEHHEKRARLYAEAKGWGVIEVYRLDAVSGEAVGSHPETKRMLADIKRGHITGLIFSKLARLARNTKQLLEFADAFRACDADLISLAEAIDTSTPAGRLFFTIIAAMAQWEREEISARVAASVPIRARLGKSLGGAAPFGYRWDNKALCIDETEAPVRALMYELFRVERRIKTTADLLNAKGYRTRNGGLFSDNTVNRLLRDPMSKGLRRTNYTTSPGKNKQWQYKPSDEWVMQECPAIVSAELWDDCNRILDEQERKPVKAGRKAQHLLSGYVSCTCGNRMYIRHTSNNYACQTCKTRINEIDLDEIFHGQMDGRIASLDPEAYRTELAQTLAEKEALHARTVAERAKLAKRKTELVNLRLDGELDKTLFQEEYKPLETRILQLDAELPALEASIAFNRVQSLSTEAALLDAQSLSDHWTDMPFPEKRAIVETILEGIVIGTDSVTITFAYNPSLSGNPGNTPRNLRGS